MKTRTIARMLAGMLLLAILQAGCAPVAQTSATPPIPTPAENLPPTATASPQSTATPAPPPIPAAAPLVEASQVAFVQMTDEQNGWGILDMDPDSRLAAIGRTSDGGQTWYSVTPAGAEAFTEDDAVFFLDSHAAWLLLPNEEKTGSLYSTNDGGTTWAMANPIPFGEASFSFADEMFDWALTHPIAGDFDTVTLFRTTDSGQSWQPVYSNDPASPAGSAQPSTPERPLYVTFIDAQTGWLSASAEDLIGLYFTQDAGANWTRQDLELPQFQASHPGLRLISFSQPRRESAYTQAGKPVFFNRYDGVLPVFISREGKAYLVFYVTRNGGQTWTASQPISYTSGTAIAVASVDDFFVWDGSNNLMATHDGGQTWNGVSTFLTDPVNPLTGEPDPSINWHESSPLIAGMQFINGTTGWATVSDSQSQHTYVYKTTDGGQTWTQVIGEGSLHGLR